MLGILALERLNRGLSPGFVTVVNAGRGDGMAPRSPSHVMYATSMVELGIKGYPNRNHWSAIPNPPYPGKSTNVSTSTTIQSCQPRHELQSCMGALDYCSVDYVMSNVPCLSNVDATLCIQVAFLVAFLVGFSLRFWLHLRLQCGGTPGLCSCILARGGGCQGCHLHGRLPRFFAKTMRASTRWVDF